MPAIPMDRDKAEKRRSHSFTVDSRSRITVTGIVDVGSFNEQAVELLTDYGGVAIKGRGLHVRKVNLETGDMSIEGTIDCVEYTNKRAGKDGRSLLSKIFR